MSSEAPPGGTAVTSQPQSRIKPAVVGLAGAALVVVVALAVLLFFFVLRHQAAIGKLVPDSAAVVLVANLDPSLGQKANLLSLSQKFPKLKTSQDLSRQIDDTLNQGFKGSGLSFDKDIKPWLGSKLGVTVTVSDKPAVMFMVDSRDDAKARAALSKLRNSDQAKAMHWSDSTYQGQTVSVGTSGDGSEPAVYAYVDHTVLVANNESLVHDAIDADRGARGRLVESSQYKATAAQLPADNLLLLYADGGPIVRQLKNSLRSDTTAVPASSLNQLDAFRSVGFAISAQSDGLAADLQIRLDASKLDAATRTALSQRMSLSPVTDRVPAKAYAFFATNAIKQSAQALADQAASSGTDAKQALDQLGLTGPGGALAHLTGLAAVELAPSSSPAPGGALIVTADDSSSLKAFFDNVASSAEQSGTASVQKQNHNGVEVTIVNDPSFSQQGYAPAYAVTGRLAIVGTTPDQVFAVLDANGQQGIAGNGSYRTVAGRVDQDPDATLFVDIAQGMAEIRAALPPSSQAQYDQDVAPNIGPLKALILTGKQTPDRLSERLFLKIQ
ncbi:MAG TPA: DUF3352 domain-containing protein [Candidatus Dormibacteraeota bacterium]|nr:DUF3352 domain-containing protein [Candidatus Dormibacteraeota bacterium]